MVLIFNDIAGSEILLILFFILIFFGAKSIPGLAKTLGKTIRQVKEASSEIQNEIRKSSEEMKGDLNLKGILEETAEDIKRPLDQYAADIDNAVKYQPPNKRTTLKASEHSADETPKADATSESEASVQKETVEKAPEKSENQE